MYVKLQNIECLYCSYFLNISTFFSQYVWTGKHAYFIMWDHEILTNHYFLVCTWWKFLPFYCQNDRDDDGMWLEVCSCFVMKSQYKVPIGPSADARTPTLVN